MHSLKIDTLQDAHNVIRRYGLDRFVWSAGSAQGFADRLFLDGHPHLDVAELSRALEAYVEEANAVDDLDEMLRAERESAEQVIDIHMKARLDLAEQIRKFRCQPGGGECWAAIGAIATSPSPVEHLTALAKGLPLLSIKGMLDILASTVGRFEDSLGLGYVPGESPVLDELIRVDISRLDETLISLPRWAGREPELIYELGALQRLATDELLLRALDAWVMPQAAI